MFIINNFTPIGGQTNRKSPTLFSYCNLDDRFLELFYPGYFNLRRNLFHAGDTILVRMKDEMGQIYIKAIEGQNVVLENKAIVAGDMPTDFKAEEPEEEKPKKEPKKRTRKKAA